MKQTTLLVILDGFGYSEHSQDNAIAQAQTPVWDALWQNHPRSLISGSGVDVGLPAGQMGNSEVGHMNLGAGRIVHQDFSRINHAIDTEDFAQNPVICDVFTKLEQTNGALHVMGLLSAGGVHSHEEQIFALIRNAAAKGIREIYLHGFLDGRDTPPRSAAGSIKNADALFGELGCGQFASLTGRYFAMDRDRRWDRLERAYNLIVRGEAPFHAADAMDALDAAYARGETDEFIQPVAIHAAGDLPVKLKDEDALVFMNFRADRARQLTRAIADADFDGFTRRSTVNLSSFITLTQYADDIKLPCAFGPERFVNTLGEYLAKQNMQQLRIAETEKYAHVTFFFSGGREEPFDGEERVLIPSPNVATYDLQPEMNAKRVTNELVDAIHAGRFDVIVCNYANGDMVGHTGKLQPAIQAVETLDRCLGSLQEAINSTGGQMLVTADHGNCEQMRDPNTQQEHTAHTSNLVPLVYIGQRDVKLVQQGALADVAPTLLELMGLPVPEEMTGRSLIDPASQGPASGRKKPNSNSNPAMPSQRSA